MIKVTIEIPDGKCCKLIKKDMVLFECPCLKTVGAPSYEVCGLYNVELEGTNNSTKKCDQCKVNNK